MVLNFISLFLDVLDKLKVWDERLYAGQTLEELFFNAFGFQQTELFLHARQTSIQGRIHNLSVVIVL